MIKIIFCMSLIVGVVICYDFKDSYYNEVLLNDFIQPDVSEPFVVARDRRQAKEDDKCKKQHHHHHHKPQKCCNDGTAENEIHEKMKATKKECFQEIKEQRKGRADEPTDMFSCEKMNRTKEDIICAMSCVGKKFEIVEDDGNLIEGKLKAFVRENFATAQWQIPLSDGFVDECVVEAKEKSETREEGKCNPAMSQFGYCMWRNFILACPAEMQETSKKCEKLREKVKNKELVHPHDHHED